MSEEGLAYCACLRVTYQPEDLPDGAKRERWKCADCGSLFTRYGYAQELHRDSLTTALAERDAAARERDQVLDSVTAIAAERDGAIAAADAARAGLREVESALADALANLDERSAQLRLAYDLRDGAMAMRDEARELLRRLEAGEPEVGKGGEDTRRLDWLEPRPRELQVGYCGDLGHFAPSEECWWVYEGDRILSKHPTLRAAIDAAMREAPQAQSIEACSLCGARRSSVRSDYCVTAGCNHVCIEEPQS